LRTNREYGEYRPTRKYGDSHTSLPHSRSVQISVEIGVNMAKTDNTEAAHLKWLVVNRSQNQATSLALFNVLESHSDHVKNPATDVAQALVGVTFSLWRAVFLTDRQDTLDGTITDARAFLGRLIIDNAINYPQDRSLRDWSFTYYLSNARYRLRGISLILPEVVPATQVAPPHVPDDANKSQFLWEYYQSALTEAVPRFDNYCKLAKSGNNATKVSIE
jgi:hypothetical protein